MLDTNASCQSQANQSAVLTSELALDYMRRILLAPVYDIAKVTDLTRLDQLSAGHNNQIFLKREDQQPVHSFKLRGAYNKLSKLNKSQLPNGVIAASAGNHAQGLALASKKLGINVTIVMPITTPDIKVNNVRRLGADVRLVGKSFNEAQHESLTISQQEQKLIIHPFDDPDVIAGQGTVAKEILQQQSNIDAVFIPVGGGGLLAGMSVYLKQLRPDIKVIGVEAEDSACLLAALEQGHPIDLNNVGLFADGVAVKRIGDHTFNLIKHYCDEVITVNSDEICTSIKDIFEHTRVIAEPAGALSLAGLNKYCQTSIGGQSLVAVLSGANMNFHNLRYISERCELGENKEAVFSVTIPEQKGSFRQFSKALSGRGITEFNYRYSGDSAAKVFVGVRITGGVQERLTLQKKLTEVNYQVKDFTENELAKLHVRYMIGGQPPETKTERIFQFQFPEYPGALDAFLETLGQRWNITLFHYRNHGAAFGQVLAGFEVTVEQELDFFKHLKYLNYEWQEATQNPAYNDFLHKQ
ncbi:threonine ammonia-lyase, biosynthetic [Parashewanella spongiae]|uniref:L-threonine dehydratase n=1 Tax=Parashewanella spongiae TaxID=342950 RepID=A0A3A6TBZ8_9GAMM|nr:threonine ammonia-lyase, biosynthetic [Parashewanella spongiae]MCL1079615.1 threonine ammonia-lyase, biosynthetic [Parashewanella spongiae]RJY07185.1 threonine ammonia-lyase, biosynthetic [Parashewanella spongiae]